MTVKDFIKHNVSFKCKRAIIEHTDKNGITTVCNLEAYNDEMAEAPIKAIEVKDNTLIFEV